MVAGGIGLAIAIVITVALGLFWKRRQGVIYRKTIVLTDPELAVVRKLIKPDQAVTLIQFSTELCTTCARTRQLLTELANHTTGLSHSDIDVTDQPELARKLGIYRAPTTMAFSSQGVELFRIGGLPQQTELLNTLIPYLPEPVG